MNFAGSDDQRAFLDAVARFVDRNLGAPLVPERFQHSPGLERALEDAGFFECTAIEELGPVAAAAMVMELCRLPICAEVGASALVRPAVDAQMPRPWAMLGEREDAAVRFLPVARTVVRIREGEVQAAAVDLHHVEPVVSVFAYPMGRLCRPDALSWQPLPHVAPERVRNSWRLAVAAEIAGCLDAGLRIVVQHVKDRRQFGRALGSFQAVQHRLAECATLVEAARWLTLRAADTGTTLDAATAAGYAQDAVRKVAYDLHQFMGAMGLTLEHPLHRWTYRARLLRAELGGPERQLAAAARAAWTEAETPA